jgi:DNA-binding transcriptional LysR family regulator
MELNKLRYFYIVAKYEHMTRAAEEIHIAQPALTKTIKALEDELGVPLFMKKGRNIALTPFGEYLKIKLDGIFPQLDRIPEELKSLQTQKKHTVRLNVLAASTAVTNAIISYKKSHPHIIFELIQNEADANCDISVMTGNFMEKNAQVIRKQCEMEEKIYLAVPKNSPYATLSSIELSTVQSEEFVSLAGSRPFRSICDTFCALSGFRLKPSFESDSPIAVQNIIGAGAGVGFWPEYSWGKISASDTVLLPISSPVCARKLIVTLYENAAISEVAEDFYHHLIRYLQRKRRNREHGNTKS